MKGSMIKRLSALILATCLILGLTGCGEDTSLFTGITEVDTSAWQAATDPLEQTEEMLGLSNMKEMISDGGLTLYMNEKTTEIAIKTQDGTVWYSNPQNRLSYNGTKVGEYSSQILVKEIDDSDTVVPVNNFEQSVQYGQFNINTDTASKTVTVDYLFGKKIAVPLYPMAMTTETYQKIYDTLSKKDQYKFSTYYVLIDMDKEGMDPNEERTIKENFTNAESLRQFRKLKNSPSGREIKYILSYLENVNFTEDDRDAEEEAVGYVKSESKTKYCTISINYTLKDGRLSVNIPTDQIKTSSGLIIQSITVMPFWNTESGRSTTDMLLPDGSGAIVHMYENVISNTLPYKERLYGTDYSKKQSNGTSAKKSLYFPMYGLINNDGAMYAVATESDGIASLTIQPAEKEDQLSYGGFEFMLVETEEVRMNAAEEKTVTTYADEAVLDPITVDFTFLPKEQNKWTDIAKSYKARLVSEGKLSTAGTGDQVPLAIDFIGAADDIKTVVGVPTENIVQLTTFAQAGDIAKTLHTALPNTELILSYEGWASGGMKASIQKSLNVESKVGSVSDLQNLQETAKSLNARFFPMVDVQYVYRNNLFDGFTTSGDAARGILREAAYKPTFNASNFMADKDGFYGFLVAPSKQSEALSSFLKDYGNRTDITGLGLTYMASDLSSDYNRSRFVSRNAALQKAQEMLSEAATDHDLMSKGANAYALPSLDVAANVAMTCNASPLIAYSVPMTQMILSGTMTYVAEDWNSQADSTYYMLQCIETGSVPNFTVVEADNSKLKYTKYDQWFNVTFSTIRPTIETISSTVTEALSDVYGAAIVDYERLTDQVVKVTYDNGHYVIVNYGSTAYTADSGVVEPASYLKG